MPIALSIIASALVGCSTPEQRQYYESQRQLAAQTEQDRRAYEYAAYIERLRAQCASFGFQPGTDGFARCVQAEAQKAEAASQRDAAVAACKSAIVLQPKKTPFFSESMANAAKCDVDPQAHLRKDDAGIKCVRNLDGSVVCRPE